MSDRLRIIVLGYLVRGPLGGLAWHHLQYVLGLADLGHDVHFLEDSDDYPSCYDPLREVTDTDPGHGLRFTREVFERVGLADRWAYHDAHTARWLGPAAARALTLCAEADVVLNLSGVNPLRAWFAEIPVRVLVDTDPAFTQIRHLTDPAAMELARRHTAFFTFGENVGRPESSVPDDGLSWQPTRQPVVLAAWPPTPGRPDAPYTTVMQWDSYAHREYAGQHYGMKSASFPEYLDLPRRVRPTLEIALGSPNAPRTELTERGWALRDPRAVSEDPWTYQDYIQRSKAEFSLAKHGYVVSASGWFSERSACYLATGRPVVLQDCAFSQWLPTGEGVLAFDTPQQAIACIEAVEGAYEFHCRKAREVAEASFDARAVLASLIERAMQPSDRAAPAS